MKRRWLVGLMVVGTLNGADGPCAGVEPWQLQHLSFAICPFDQPGNRGSDVAFSCGQLPLKNAANEPVRNRDAVSRCALFLAQECPGYDPFRDAVVDPLCRKIWNTPSPPLFVSGFEKQMEACEFVTVARAVMTAKLSDEARENWCLYSIRDGERDLSCLEVIRPRLAAKLLRPAGSHTQWEGWIASMFRVFARPEFKPLVPWLKSLPVPKHPGVRESRDLAVAVHTRDRKTIARIAVKGSVAIQEAMYWHFILFPDHDLRDDARRLKATPAMIPQINRTLEIFKAHPDTGFPTLQFQVCSKGM